MKIGQITVNDAPDNVCFGCSPHNERGLRLTFRRTNDRMVECRYTAAEHLAGAPGVVHGGIQATLLDETLGMTARTVFDEKEAWLVTADLRLRFRRPVPSGVPLVIRGEVQRHEGDDVYVEGAILDESGESLTIAESRWRRISPPS